jgi:hypothetical protein
MRWLLVDKLQGEVTPFGSVTACQKIIGFGAVRRIADAKLGFPAAACGETLISRNMKILKAELVQGSQNKHQAGVRGRSLKSLESAGCYSFEW